MSARYEKPKISTVCASCNRKRERESYARLTPEQKKAKGDRANKVKAKRRRKLEEQIMRARMIHDKKDPKWDDKRVDLIPFRMWVIGQIRIAGGIKPLSVRLGVDEAAVRRWANGFEWDETSSWCEPHPILTVNVVTVDSIGVKMDDPGLLDRLYPFVDQYS